MAVLNKKFYVQKTGQNAVACNIYDTLDEVGTPNLPVNVSGKNGYVALTTNTNSSTATPARIHRNKDGKDYIIATKYIPEGSISQAINTNRNKTSITFTVPQNIDTILLTAHLTSGKTISKYCLVNPNTTYNIDVSNSAAASDHCDSALIWPKVSGVSYSDEPIQSFWVSNQGLYDNVTISWSEAINNTEPNCALAYKCIADLELLDPSGLFYPSGNNTWNEGFSWNVDTYYSHLLICAHPTWWYSDGKFSFDTFTLNARVTSSPCTVKTISISSSGNDLLLYLKINSRTFEHRFANPQARDGKYGVRFRVATPYHDPANARIANGTIL